MILRLPDFYGPAADIGLANPIFRAALAGKTANWAGPVNTPHEFVYTPDTGSGDWPTWRCARTPTARLGISAARGPSIRWTSSRGFIAPRGARRNTARGSGTAQDHGMVQSHACAKLVEMLYLQETPVILDDSKLTARITVHKTPYDEGIKFDAGLDARRLIAAAGRRGIRCGPPASGRKPAARRVRSRTSLLIPCCAHPANFGSARTAKK